MPFSNLPGVKNIVIIVLAAISATALLVNLSQREYIREQNRVYEVVDGDTLQLESGKRVRLVGVDAPEFDRCGGAEAKERLKELVEGKLVQVESVATESYGRTLGLVYIDGLLVNEVMLKEGWGRTDYRGNKYRERITAAYHEGKDANLGIYSSLCRSTSAPKDEKCLIKTNIDKATYQKFYHFPGCKHYDVTVVEEDIGEGYLCTEKEAQEAGFVRAQGCEGKSFKP